MNYEEMSDFEINKEVAKMTDNDWHHDGGVVYKDDFDGFSQEFNPCNNPSDAWLIIVDNDIEISISRHGGFKTGDYIARGDRCRDGNENYANSIALHKNPLRAACICFLKMKDAEK